MLAQLGKIRESLVELDPSMRADHIRGGIGRNSGRNGPNWVARCTNAGWRRPHLGWGRPKMANTIWLVDPTLGAHSFVGDVDINTPREEPGFGLKAERDTCLVESKSGGQDHCLEAERHHDCRTSDMFVMSRFAGYLRILQSSGPTRPKSAATGSDRNHSLCLCVSLYCSLSCSLS